MVEPDLIACRGCTQNLHWDEAAAAWVHADGAAAVETGGKIDHFPEPDWPAATGLRPWQWRGILVQNSPQRPAQRPAEPRTAGPEGDSPGDHGP